THFCTISFSANQAVGVSRRVYRYRFAHNSSKFTLLLDEDEFADFREYTGDTLMGPYYLLFGNYFTICNQKLEEGLAIFKKENNWRPLEAALFATAAV